VREMTIEAVLAHRRMLEQKRSTLLRMALIAGLVDGVGLQQGTGQRTVRIVAIVAAHLPFRQRHVRAAVELQADVFVALRTGVADRHLRHAPLDREFRHRIVAVAAGEAVTLMHRPEPVIARTARMTAQARASLYLDRRTPIFGVRNNQTGRERIGRVLRTGAVAGFAHRNPRVGTIRNVQAERVKGVREMIRFEPMAGNAGLLANRPRIRRQRILRYVGVRESGSGPRQIAARRAVSGKICRRQRIGDIVLGRLRLADGCCAHED